MQRYMPAEWALPVIDQQNKDFFTSGRLRLQKCSACGTVQHPPEDVCWKCQGMEFGTVDAKGTGVIYSFTIAHHPVHPALQQAVPYNIVLVQLDDFSHVRIVGNVVNLSPDQIKIGLPVKVGFADINDGADSYSLPQWEAAH